MTTYNYDFSRKKEYQEDYVKSSNTSNNLIHTHSKIMNNQNKKHNNKINNSYIKNISIKVGELNSFLIKKEKSFFERHFINQQNQRNNSMILNNDYSTFNNFNSTLHQFGMQAVRNTTNSTVMNNTNGNLNSNNNSNHIKKSNSIKKNNIGINTRDNKNGKNHNINNNNNNIKNSNYKRNYSNHNKYMSIIEINTSNFNNSNSNKNQNNQKHKNNSTATENNCNIQNNNSIQNNHSNTSHNNSKSNSNNTSNHNSNNSRSQSPNNSILNLSTNKLQAKDIKDIKYENKYYNNNKYSSNSPNRKFIGFVKYRKINPRILPKIKPVKLDNTNNIDLEEIKFIRKSIVNNLNDGNDVKTGRIGNITRYNNQNHNLNITIKPIITKINNKLPDFSRSFRFISSGKVGMYNKSNIKNNNISYNNYKESIGKKYKSNYSNLNSNNLSNNYSKEINNAKSSSLINDLNSFTTTNKNNNNNITNNFTSNTNNTTFLRSTSNNNKFKSNSKFNIINTTKFKKVNLHIKRNTNIKIINEAEYYENAYKYKTPRFRHYKKI